MNQLVGRGRVKSALIGVASVVVPAIIYVAMLLQPGAPASTPAQASIPIAPVQSSVSVPATDPGYVSPFSNSVSGGSSYVLTDIELNLDPNCECLGFF